jgi:hypothetical protein
LVVGGVQRCTFVNAQGVSGFLEFLLAGFLFISSITLIVAILLLTATGGFPLILRSLAGAACFATAALPTSAILTFLFISLFIFIPLLLDKLLNILTLLEIVALGLIDFALWVIAFPSLLSSRGLPAISAHGSFLAGYLGLGLLASTRHARSLNSHHFLILAPFVALLVLFLLTGGLFIIL